ncbi:diguanylate cyclase domain-containing protein [Rubellimicrobium roseum]|uniref:diguanylate cyclase n=1 Tax=Rubellimicrobium roseum TaxID=687525 RepID=A0A5C4NJI9_9RHOB|nr:diguanylate cyclase [Rubellimicrobium roseum]TNC74120.1 diguanylate cyclase [Rubellimicrobium roseum]
MAATLKDISGSIALIALLAVAYGSVLRRFGGSAGSRAALGVLFGLAAMLAMQDPILVAEGVFVDLRHLPVTLAGAFLGWRGSLAAVGLAAAMRLDIGGQGAQVGALGLILAGLAGYLWDRWTLGSGYRGLRAMIALALLSSLHLLALLLLPGPLAIQVLAAMGPVLLPVHIAGVLVVGSLIERERCAHATRAALLRDAFHDPLTGLLNRRGFQEAMSRLPAGQDGALLIIDIDHFKRINDRYGHPAGDVILRSLGARLAAVLRQGDLLARLGGEEIGAFLPGLAPPGASVATRRLCEAIRAEPFTLPGGGTVAVTASLGGAYGPPGMLDALTARADAALYAAKHAGRNRCLFAPDAVIRPGSPNRPSPTCEGCGLDQACAGPRRNPGDRSDVPRPAPA